MKSNRILCVGDSLGLPRDGVPYEDTWFYHLTTMKNRSEFIPKFQRALTTDFLVGDNSCDYLEFYSPTCIILQVGIVDCAPRYFKSNALLPKVLGVAPKILREHGWRVLKRVKQRSAANAEVPIDKFISNLTRYFDRAIRIGVSKIIVIEIAKPGYAMILKNPLINQQVALYNSSLTKIASRLNNVRVVAPLTDSEESDFITDGYHLSAIGHQKVFKAIGAALVVNAL